MDILAVEWEGGGAGTGLMWLGIETGGGTCESHNETSGSIKCHQNS